MSSFLEGSWGSHKAHGMGGLERCSQALPPQPSLWGNVNSELGRGVLSSSYWGSKEEIGMLVSTRDPFQNSTLSMCFIIYIIC